MSTILETSETTEEMVNSSYVDFIQQERDILLGIGKDITRIREKEDLITFFSKRIKSIFYFTHTIVSLIDRRDETYSPFLLDHESSPIKGHKEYDVLKCSHFSLNDPFIQTVLNANDCVTFVLEEVMDQPKSPTFLRINYEGGIREILMKTIWNSNKPIGFIHMYSDRIGSFTEDFRSIINGISPQISNAVSNIIRNNEIKERENEKSFLLDFSNDIAAVRNKEELAVAVDIALKKISSIQDYIIHKLDQSCENLAPYIYEKGYDSVIGDPLLKEVLESSFPVEDGLHNRVLDSYIPLLFNITRELNRGISSKNLFWWKQKGINQIVGIALRNGGINLGVLWLAIEEVNISLLKGICDQISIAMANIIANESMVRLNKRQAVLLQFSNEIAGSSTRMNLQNSLIKVLKESMFTKLAMIRIIDQDGLTLSPFLYDKSIFLSEEDLMLHQERILSKIDIHEYYNSQVILNREPMVFNIEKELQLDRSPYPKLWIKTGFKNAYGALLSVGDTNLGTLWLLANDLDESIIKGICSQVSVAIDNINVNEKLMLYKKQLEEENISLKEHIKESYNFKEIIGTGQNMQKVYHLISLVAESNSTVLVLGETGTGKELIARAIHNASPRKDKVMIKVNCAAMPANLIESELFGHEKGAFTGATERRIGKFELADNGTLFLDEIGEMPLESQVKLLRVIQEREFERIGGKSSIKVNVRIIAATNRDLETEVNEGRFRSDLFYRLNVFPINLPPLRSRMEDLDTLANFFVQKYNKNIGRNIERISNKALQQLHSYLWPGNVRELEHLIERSLLMTSDNVLREVYLPKKETELGSEEKNHFGNSLHNMERTHIINVLKRCQGKISGIGGAAEILEIPGNTLHSKIKKLAILKSDYFQE